MKQLNFLYSNLPSLNVISECDDRHLRDRYPTQLTLISNFYSFNKLPKLAAGEQSLFWQYSERGRIARIPTLVDLNVFNGNKTQFERSVNTEVLSK